MSGLSILKKRKNIEPFNVHKTHRYSLSLVTQIIHEKCVSFMSSNLVIKAVLLFSVLQINLPNSQRVANSDSFWNDKRKQANKIQAKPFPSLIALPQL